MIANLYQAEREIADTENEHELLAKRRERVEPELESMKAWLEKKALHVPPQTAVEKAVGYTLGQWQKLVRYLEHPRRTPDRNRMKYKIRPLVIGRKNWLFCGSPGGGERHRRDLQPHRDSEGERD